jgi:hypothetical protein
MMSGMHSAKGWWAFGLASVGVLWTAALIPDACFFLAYSGETGSSSGPGVHTTDTLVGVNGAWVVGPLAVLLLLSLVAWLGLHSSCARGSRRGRKTGEVAAGMLAAAAVLTFSLGFLALPAAAMIVAAAGLTPARQAREM